MTATAGTDREAGEGVAAAVARLRSTYATGVTRDVDRRPAQLRGLERTPRAPRPCSSATEKLLRRIF